MDAEYEEKLWKELRELTSLINMLEGRSGPIIHSDWAYIMAKERIACIKKELGMEEGEAK